MSEQTPSEADAPAVGVAIAFPTDPGEEPGFYCDNVRVRFEGGFVIVEELDDDGEVGDSKAWPAHAVSRVEIIRI